MKTTNRIGITFNLSAGNPVIASRLPAKWLLYLLMLPFLFSSGCGIYSLGGANIPVNMKTVSVELFENNAPLVKSQLSSLLTNALRDRIRNQTKLNFVRSQADGTFEGTITDYSINPVAVTGNDRAGLNRLTITVSVKYTNTVREKDSFERSFSRFVDFPPPVASAEVQKMGEVNKMLVEDIFNAAFASW